jgi:3D (Asp-Asp-Asp) domain-containing protein
MRQTIRDACWVAVVVVPLSLLLLRLGERSFASEDARRGDSGVEAAPEAPLPAERSVVPAKAVAAGIVPGTWFTAPRGDFEWYMFSVAHGNTKAPTERHTLDLLAAALNAGKRASPAKTTAYCSRCPDGGGKQSAWFGHIRQGYVAVDPRYHRPGERIWFGAPWNTVLVAADTGGAIKGRNRFDVCLQGTARHECPRYGCRTVPHVVLGR